MDQLRQRHGGHDLGGGRGHGRHTRLAKPDAPSISQRAFQAFSLNFNAAAGAHYDFRTYWYRRANAPRRMQRSVVLRPGPAALFTGVQVVNGTARFTFTRVPGRTYSLLAGCALAPSRWNLIASVTVPANLGFAQVSDAPPGSARFYRLSYP